MKCINAVFIMTVCCTGSMLQGSQAQMQWLSQLAKDIEGTSLEQMIREVGKGTLTKEKLQAYREHENFDINAFVDGRTALMTAVLYKQPAMVQLLVAEGADLNIQTADNKDTALLLALRNKHQLASSAENKPREEIVKLLINAGANVNLLDDDGKSAIFWAIRQYWSSEIIKLLIGHGADINIQDKNGWTVLMKAARDYQPKIVVMLLEAGANPYIQSYSKENIKKRLKSENWADEVIERKPLSHADKNFFTVYPEILEDSEVKKALANNKYVLERQVSEKMASDK